jgi:hypothetical protein
MPIMTRAGDDGEHQRKEGRARASTRRRDVTDQMQQQSEPQPQECAASAVRSWELGAPADARAIYKRHTHNFFCHHQRKTYAGRGS